MLDKLPQKNTKQTTSHPQHKMFIKCISIYLILQCLHSIPLSTNATTTIIRSNFDTTTPHWKDTNGNRIEAHAAGLLQALDTYYYWYGESKKTKALTSHGVNCYRSLSLAGPWEFVGQVLTQKEITGPTITIPGPYVIERPKVIYNAKNKLYVMWFHLDDSRYKFRHAGVATSFAPQGPFTFKYALQPDHIPSLDINLWLDPFDGEAYFVRSCDNKYAGISGMTSDYMNTTGILSKHSRFEGMALFRSNNETIYLISSHLTGWNPNPLMLFRNDGPSMKQAQWTLLGNPTNDSTSFNTQPTYVVAQKDQNGQQYFIYLADNWLKDNGLINAGYVWLPFWFEKEASGSSEIVLKKQLSWDLKDPFAMPPEEEEEETADTETAAPPQRVI